MPDFESDARRANERLREDARGGGPTTMVVGFEDTEGQPRPIIGDSEVPYVGIVGRASTTPTAADPGVPAVETGQNQRVLTDPYGRIIAIAGTAPPADLPTTVSLIPQIANAGVLVVSAVPAVLFDAWLGDFTGGGSRYLLVFDDTVAPLANDIPVLAAIPDTGGWMNYDFSEVAGPVPFGAGIVLAVSSTPNKYTAIVPAADFAITARYKVS